LRDGRIRPEGIALNYLDLPVEETFYRFLHNGEFDAAEMSLAAYVLSCDQEVPPFVAIPVFPSRAFRHSFIFVSERSGIRFPRQIAGKRIGLPDYALTAPIWLRGLLAEEYGVPPESASYFIGGEETPKAQDAPRLPVPSGVDVRRIGPAQTLAGMLEEGEIDVLYTARAPSSFHSSSGKVRRLFDDHARIEQDYFERTGIFPIMHVVSLRRAVHDAAPWIARSLYRAFDAAKKIAQDELHTGSSLKVMLPWLREELDRTEAVMGTNFWPYGLQSNARTLDKFLQYCAEQSLISRRFRPSDLFAKELL
jgi:4,5-dihydroxyphthalate decarboxylase